MNGLWVCRTCHRGAHEHPAEARDVYGWIVSASPNVKPEDVPLLVNGNRWVRLEATGYRTAPEGWAA